MHLAAVATAGTAVQRAWLQLPWAAFGLVPPLGLPLALQQLAHAEAAVYGDWFGALAESVGRAPRPRMEVLGGG